MAEQVDAHTFTPFPALADEDQPHILYPKDQVVDEDEVIRPRHLTGMQLFALQTNALTELIKDGFNVPKTHKLVLKEPEAFATLV